MPDYPSSRSRFLNEEESILACNRLSADGIGLTQGRGVEHIPHWVAFKMTVTDWRVWAQCFMFILVTGSQTMQYFIPTLVGSFGWTGVQGQCKLCSQTIHPLLLLHFLTKTDHTIPAYMAALVYVVGSCYLADRFKAKWQFVCGLSGLGCILFIAVTTVTNKTTQYVLTIFAFGTIYGCSPLVKTWVSDVIPQPAAKRAIAIALINSIGNASSIYATWLWPKTDAPRYIAGFATTTSWLGILCVSAVVFAWLFKKYPVEKANHAEAIAADLRDRSGEGENKA